MFRLWVSALAALFVLSSAIPASSSQASSASAKRVFDALRACKPDFFALLKAGRQAFGPVQIQVFDDPKNALHGPGAQSEYWSAVTFGQPVNADGFSLLRFLQRRHIVAGKPESYSWAFQVAATLTDVRRLMEERYGVELVRPWVMGAWGVAPEAAPEEQGGISTLLKIAGYDGGTTTITCELESGDIGDFRMPEAVQVFGAPEIGLPPLKDTDGLMKALLFCEPDFFVRLKKERASFGETEVFERRTVLSSSQSKSKKPSRAAALVIFPVPIEIWGIAITGYTQRTDSVDGKRQLTWGFQTRDGRDQLAEVLRLRTGAQPLEGDRWGLDLTTEDTGYAPSPSFKIADGLLTCTVPADGAESDPATLFLTAKQ
ncbi:MULTISPECIES: hypothetical protein [unclassified Ensifer]|uniref:hypothetical protein n=1 Tax=unclassified Ensifer TaxID=2633371 RepID=UPI000A5C4715|nr:MULTISPECIES: hypothetical protein [unclassified Ensifer]